MRIADTKGSNEQLPHVAWRKSRMGTDSVVLYYLCVRLGVLEEASRKWMLSDAGKI